MSFYEKQPASRLNEFEPHQGQTVALRSYGFALAPDRLAKLVLLVLSFARFKLGHFSPQQCNYRSSFGFTCR
jgi:hypothetical protein